MDTVRSEYYKRVPLATCEEGKFVGGGARKKKNARQADQFTLPASFTPGEHRKGTVSLGITTDASGSTIASHVNFSLDDPVSLNGRAIPIGDVFMGQPFVEWAAEQMANVEGEKKKVRPQISLVNLYTYDILPDPIKELADKPLAERQALDVESASPSQALPRPTRVDEIIKKDLPRVTFRTNKGKP